MTDFNTIQKAEKGVKDTFGRHSEPFVFVRHRGEGRSKYAGRVTTGFSVSYPSGMPDHEKPDQSAVIDKFLDLLSDMGHPAPEKYEVKERKHWTPGYVRVEYTFHFPLPTGPMAGEKAMSLVTTELEMFRKECIASRYSISQSWKFKTGEKVRVVTKKGGYEAYLICTYRRPSGIGGYLILKPASKTPGYVSLRVSQIEKLPPAEQNEPAR